MINDFNTRSIKDFDWQKFLNSHAEKHWREDMAEQIELRTLIEAWEAKYPEQWTLSLKYETACIMFDTYKNSKDRLRNVDEYLKRFP